MNNFQVRYDHKSSSLIQLTYKNVTPLEERGAKKRCGSGLKMIIIYS